MPETSLKYEEPTGEFKLFKMKYGDMPEGLGDRLGAALLYLGATNQKIDAGFKMLGEKQDDTIEAIREVSEKIERSKEEIVTEISSLRETFLF